MLPANQKKASASAKPDERQASGSEFELSSVLSDRSGAAPMPKDLEAQMLDKDDRKNVDSDKNKSKHSKAA